MSLVCAIFLLEGATRGWVARSAARAAHDTLNIRSLARAADAMHAHGGYKVLVLGNSLAHDGVRADGVRAGLEKAGRSDPAVFLATPSGSTAMHWDYALQRYFLRPGLVPDEVFLCGHPWHFTDQPDETARLRAFYVADADFERALGDMRGWDEKAGFVLARASALWGVNTGLKVRLLDLVIPHYEEMETQLQRMRWDYAASSAAVTSCTHLVSVLDELHARHIRAHLVAMPTIRQPAQVSAAVLQTGAAHGAEVIDLTTMAGLDAGCYTDGFHLNDKGAALFSQQLALAVEAGH